MAATKWWPEERPFLLRNQLSSSAGVGSQRSQHRATLWNTPRAWTTIERERKKMVACLNTQKLKEFKLTPFFWSLNQPKAFSFSQSQIRPTGVQLKMNWFLGTKTKNITLWLDAKPNTNLVEINSFDDVYFEPKFAQAEFNLKGKVGRGERDRGVNYHLILKCDLRTEVDRLLSSFFKIFTFLTVGIILS